MTEPLSSDPDSSTATTPSSAAAAALAAPAAATSSVTSSNQPKPGGRGKIVVIAVAAVLGALAFSVLTSKKSTTTTKPKAGSVVSTSTAPVAASAASDVSAVAAPALSAEPGENQLVKVTGDVLANLEDGADAAIGKPAPVVEGFGFDGKPIKIDPADGKPKVIFFLAHWCPHCQREVPLIAKWQKEGKLPTNLAYYTVSTAVQTKGENFPPSAWLAKENWPFPVMADDKNSTAVKSFGFGGFPFFVVLRADGTVGGRASGEKELEELLALLAKAG